MARELLGPSMLRVSHLCCVSIHSEMHLQIVVFFSGMHDPHRQGGCRLPITTSSVPVDGKKLLQDGARERIFSGESYEPPCYPMEYICQYGVELLEGPFTDYVRCLRRKTIDTVHTTTQVC